MASGIVQTPHARPPPVSAPGPASSSSILSSPEALSSDSGLRQRLLTSPSPVTGAPASQTPSSASGSSATTPLPTVAAPAVATSASPTSHPASAPIPAPASLHVASTLAPLPSNSARQMVDSQINDDDDDMSFFSFIKSEFSLPTHKDPSPGRTADRIHIFFQLPYQLERFLLLGQAVCTNSFLFLLSLLPFRILMAFGVALLSIFKPSEWASSILKQHRCDIARGTLIAIALYVVSHVSTAELYHYVRAQSTMKLYVIFNMLAIFDRLLTSLGDDIYDAMFTSLNPPPSGPKSSTLFVIGHFLLAVVYICAHSFAVLIHVATLNVSINSDGIALFVLLNSSNFIELKSSVFKKFFHANLFQLTCSDAVERFQAMMVVIIIVIQNISTIGLTKVDSTWLWHLAYVVCRIYVMELLVDWFKHGFMNKFNHLPSYYRSFRTVICRDIVLFRANQNHPYYHSVARRFGCIVDPMGVVFIRALAGAIIALPCSLPTKIIFILSIVVSLLAAKLFLGISLVSYASYHINKYSNGNFDPMQVIVLPLDPSVVIAHPGQPPTTLAAASAVLGGLDVDALTKAQMLHTRPTYGNDGPVLSTGSFAPKTVANAATSLEGIVGLVMGPPSKSAVGGANSVAAGAASSNSSTSSGSNNSVAGQSVRMSHGRTGSITSIGKTLRPSTSSLLQSPMSSPSSSSISTPSSLSSGDPEASNEVVGPAPTRSPSLALNTSSTSIVPSRIPPPAPTPMTISGFLKVPFGATSISPSTVGSMRQLLRGGGGGGGDDRGALPEGEDADGGDGEGDLTIGQVEDLAPIADIASPTSSSSTSNSVSASADPEKSDSRTESKTSSTRSSSIPSPPQSPDNPELTYPVQASGPVPLHPGDINGVVTALGPFMNLGGFSRTDADKNKAAIPIEAVVRYNIYSNKIPI